jgi:MFS transporter, Spinster family, sphingosine-1-phosphate transporter
MVWGKKLLRSESQPGERQEGARFALLVLSGINLLNFADRYVPSGVKELIKDDLNLTDAETSLPTTGMIFVYMIFAIIFGWIGDKGLIDRRTLLALGIFSWSLATALAGLAQNLTQLILLRSLVGIGEAAYATIAPPMISDFYPHADRNIAFGIYYLAIPVGSALGFGIGSVLGALFSWRVAFLAVGLPGVILSFTVLYCNDPVFGINDDLLHSSSSSSSTIASTSVSLDSSNDSGAALVITQTSSPLMVMNSPISTSSTSSSPPSSSPPSSSSFSQLKQDMKIILTNPHFNLSLAGLVANLFAMGGLAEWFPTFLNRYDHLSIAQSGLIIGTCMVLGGIGGNMLGAKTTEYCVTSYHSLSNPEFLVSALYTLPATFCLLIAINITGNQPLAILAIFFAVICLFTNLAPMASLSITCIPPSLRARSCAIQIFLQHVLGDMISPPIIGLISDETNSLKTGLQITWMAVLLSGVFWFVGYGMLSPIAIPVSHRETNTPTYLDLLFDRHALTVKKRGRDEEQEQEEEEDISCEIIRLEAR